MKPAKLFSPRFSLLFISLPQALLTAFFWITFQSAEVAPALPLLIVLGIQAAFNLCIIANAVKDWKNPAGKKSALLVQLIGFLALMTAATPLLLKQFTSAAVLSAETVYGVLCLVPLVYLATATLHRYGASTKGVGVKIALCVGFPLLMAVITYVVYNYNIGGGAYARIFGGGSTASVASDLLLFLFFALFFAFVCLVASLVYHFRAKKAARLQQDADAAGSNDQAAETAETGAEAQSAEGKAAPKKRSVGYTIFIAIVALLLPINCLALSNSFAMKILGDFTNPWFYILAVVNGAAMLIPVKNKRVALAALFCKAMGFLYVLYFTVVFLEFVPVGIALFYFMAPLLLLTPVVLLVAELLQIIDDFKFLKQFYATRRIAAVFACGMALLCVAFLGNCYAQKVNFGNAV